MVFMYSASFFFFMPALVIFYNYYPGTFMTFRIYEIAFSGWQFWLVLLLLIGACVAPIYFYYQVQYLLFPELKDLIRTEALDNEKVLRDVNPVRAKAAHDMFKAQQ
jgi:hypothetical protein